MNDEKQPAQRKPESITVSRRDFNRPGLQTLRYAEPQNNARGDLLSPRAQVKRVLAARGEAAVGHRLSPRQLKRWLKEQKRLAKKQPRSRPGVA